MKHMGSSNKSLFWQALIISIVQGIILPDVIVLWVLLLPEWSHLVFLVFLLTVLTVFPALVGLDTTVLSCIINHLHFRSCSTLQCSQATWQKHPNVCNSPLITKQPDSPVAAAQPDEPIVLLCFWSELRGADCQGTPRHFSASVAANLQIAPCRPKLMEGQFGGSKGLNGSPCAPLTSRV